MSNTNTKVIQSFICFAVVVFLAATILPLKLTSAATCTSSPCSTTFEVNVKETLSVAVTTPTEWASGDTDEFLRNKVSIDVSSNNASGFTASMYSQDTTNLTNAARSTITMPTLASYSVRSAFPANYWGYSLGSGTISGSSITYGETDAGNNNSRYYPLATSSSPIKILTGTSAGSQDIYFGAKANMNQASGTYVGTVIISVVTGTINENTNPMTPTNPATPSGNEVASYASAPTGGANGSTTYTYTRVNSSAHTSTTTTQVSDGDNVSSYNGYQPPQGVIENTITKVVSESSVAAGLATTASVAAATGMFFFIAAKRKEDEEEEEESLI